MSALQRMLEDEQQVRHRFRKAMTEPAFRR